MQQQCLPFLLNKIVMDIKSAEFIASFPKYKDCPDPNLPEYAFVGRSNVGKSSLINMLMEQKKSAKTHSIT